MSIKCLLLNPSFARALYCLALCSEHQRIFPVDFLSWSYLTDNVWLFDLALLLRGSIIVSEAVLHDLIIGSLRHGNSPLSNLYVVSLLLLHIDCFWQYLLNLVSLNNLFVRISPLLFGIKKLLLSAILAQLKLFQLLRFVQLRLERLALLRHCRRYHFRQLLFRRLKFLVY